MQYQHPGDRSAYERYLIPADCPPNSQAYKKARKNVKQMQRKSEATSRRWLHEGLLRLITATGDREVWIDATAVQVGALAMELFD